jgi:hypothetical protein
MFGAKHQKLIPFRLFVRRMALSLLITGLLAGASLLLGTAGYHWLAGFSLIDAFYNASMIMTGMGPAAELPSTGAKLFASFYALYSGLVLIAVMGLLLAPIVHRILHRFHVDDRDVV